MASLQTLATNSILSSLERFLHIIPSDEVFCEPSDLGDGGTLGKHTRHILEHYFKLLDAAEELQNSIENKSDSDDVHLNQQVVVNYDDRQRDSHQQDSTAGAVDAIGEIMERTRLLQNELLNLPLMVENITYTGDGQMKTKFMSTLERELHFVNFHAIHHCFILRMIWKDVGSPNTSEYIDREVGRDFGIAPSTMFFRQNEHSNGGHKARI